MPSNCTFEFDRPNPVYYSGETVSGCITLRTTSEKTVRGVYIIFEGAAKVLWEEDSSRKTTTYRAKTTYLDTKTCVFGDGTLPSGTHEYYFTIALPTQCPTACTEKYGKISYELTLKVDRPFRFDNVFTQPLTVIKQLDLNHSSEYLVPLRGEDVKYFCCWPCSSGPVISTLTIPFGGWAPGQEIPYKLEVDNQSPGYDLNGTELKLNQLYSFTSRTPRSKTRKINNILAVLEDEDRTVLRLSKRTFKGKLRIPSVPPTLDAGIITVTYRIEMDVHTGDFHKDAKIWVPITIGTIPLTQSVINQRNVVVQPTAPTPDTSDSLPPSYDVFLPPTFEEATHIGAKFKDTDKDEYHSKSTGEWVPKYPMYTSLSLPTAASAPPYNERNDIVAESRPSLHVALPSS